MMSQLDGIDCSSNQDCALDQGYDEVIAAGAYLAFEKATGSTSTSPWATYTNPFFEHRRQLIAQKFRCGGAYLWVQVGAPAPLQVSHFIKVVGDLGREGIQVDSEQPGVTDQMTIDVVNLLYAHYGPRIIVYGNLARLKGIVDHIPADVYFWLPWYDDPWHKVQKAIEAAGLTDRIVVWQWGGGKQGFYLQSLNARVDSNHVLNPALFHRICGVDEPAHHPVTHNANTDDSEDDVTPFSMRPAGYANQFVISGAGVQVASVELLGRLGVDPQAATVFTHRPTLLSFMRQTGLTKDEMTQAGEPMPPEHQL